MRLTHLQWFASSASVAKSLSSLGYISSQLSTKQLRTGSMGAPSPFRMTLNIGMPSPRFQLLSLLRICLRFLPLSPSQPRSRFRDHMQLWLLFFLDRFPLAQPASNLVFRSCPSPRIPVPPLQLLRLCLWSVALLRLPAHLRLLSPLFSPPPATSPLRLSLPHRPLWLF